jgi:hypothetical protein
MPLTLFAPHVYRGRSARAYAWTDEAPNFTDFQAWVTYMMGVPPDNMPDVITLEMAYDEAMNLALPDLAAIPCQPGTPSLYALAVYNLGGAVLVDIAQDAVGSTYWQDLRGRFNTSSFAFGITSSASDQGTSSSMTMPKFVQDMMPLDLWMMQTPWGRMYMMIAGAWGTVWGLTR